jgi:hypothetical protein
MPRKKTDAQIGREVDEILARSPARKRGSSKPLGHWEEVSYPSGYRFVIVIDDVRFDTADVDPIYYRDPKWRQRWEFDLEKEIEKLKAGKSTYLYKMNETHYRLPGVV